MQKLAEVACTASLALTLLELLEALEGDLELIRRVKWRGVILDLDAEKRDDRHFDCYDISICSGGWRLIV